MKHLRIFVTLTVLLSITSLSPAADRWPAWRGPTGQGHSDATGLPVSWSQTENVAWKVKIPGKGWSSPVVENGQVWVTTAIDRPASKEDAERRRKTSTNSQPLTISASVSLRAVGVDLRTGELLRDVEVLTEKNPQMIHVENSYATPTPIIENGRLYCYYGPSGIACLDTRSGKVLWSNRSLRVEHENGPGSSPVLWNNVLIVHCDGIDKQYIVAIDKNTGKVAWKTPRSGELRENPQMRKSYATSLVTSVNGTTQILSPAADWMYGYDPKDGRELWKLNYGELGFSNAARPVVGHGLIYVCTGYMRSQLLAIRVDDRAGEPVPTVVWRGKKQIPNVASPLVIGEEIYLASDSGIASCLDARTGKNHWTARIGKKIWASPLHADGRIYFFNRDATTTVIAAGKSFKKLSVNQLEGEQIATAAAVDGALILRTDHAMYCIR